MPQGSLIAATDAETLVNLAIDGARSLGYEIAAGTDDGFHARQGSLALSIVDGAFVAYCNFAVRVQEIDDTACRLRLSFASPWWTGLVGVNRVKKRAQKLLDEMLAAIQEQDIDVEEVKAVG